MTVKAKTIDIELNRKLRKSLEKYKKIETPAVSLFAVNDIYARPPYFAFRFNNGLLADYYKLKSIVENFKGELKWCMTTKEDRKNWLIEPEILKKLRNSDKIYDKENLLKLLGEGFYKYCDKALQDIKPLCDLIEDRYMD